MCVSSGLYRLLVQLLILGLSLKYTLPFFGLRTDSEMRYEITTRPPKKDPARVVASTLKDEKQEWGDVINARRSKH